MPISPAWARRSKAVIFGVGLALAAAVSVNWWQIFVSRVPLCSKQSCVADFVAIYTGVLIMRFEPTTLYDSERQRSYQQRVVQTERTLPFVYPPATAYLLVPLAWLDFSSAFLAITALNILLLWATLRHLIRHLQLTIDQIHWLLLFTLASFAVHTVLFFGQTSFLILFVLARMTIACRREKQPMTGFWLGMTLLKPQLSIVPGLALLAQCNWIAVTIGLFIVVTVSAVSFYSIGFESLGQYNDLLRQLAADSDWINPVKSMHNLRALTAIWLSPPWDLYGWWSASGAVITATLSLNWRMRRKASDFEYCWIANGLAMLLLTPHLFTHDLSLLIIPCALALHRCKEQVPAWFGIGISAIALLPAVNYLVPGLMAVILVTLFVASWIFAFAQPTPSDKAT